MSPVEFFEIPQGVPSLVPAATGTAYCSASDVASLNKARTIGAGNNPTVSDIDGYILMCAGQIDGILTNKGYAVPVNTASYPETAGLLGWANATGAWAMMEEASPDSPNIDRARQAWEQAKKMLSDATTVFDLPLNQARSEPRGPWITLQPTGQVYDPGLTSVGGQYGDGMGGPAGQNSPQNPYFSRQMRF